MIKKESIYVYDNVGDFVNWLRKTKQTTKGAKYDHSNSVGDSATTYAGTESFEQAQDLMDNGDEKLSHMIMEQAVEIKAKSTAGYMRASNVVSTPQGFVPNIGAYMAGHPNNMLNIRRTFKPISKVLTIVYNCSVTAFVKTNQMISAASKVACAISTLEAKGYRVNVYVCSYVRNFSSKAKNNAVGFIVKIKDAGKPLDPLRIAYPLAHPSMLRRHGLAFYERASYALPNTYGAPVDVPRRELDMILSNYVYLSAENIVKSDNTLDAIVKQIEEQSNKS